MLVTHQKTTGLANPVDPGVVGGEDWDAAHIVAGPFVGGTYMGTFTTGGELTTVGSSNLLLERTGTGTYSGDLNSPEVDYWTVLAQAWDGSDTHYDVSSTFTIDMSGAHVELRVRTRAGSLVDLESGNLNVVAVVHGV